jgi:hypothetical protein
VRARTGDFFGIRLLTSFIKCKYLKKKMVGGESFGIEGQKRVPRSVLCQDNLIVYAGLCKNVRKGRKNTIMQEFLLPA